MASNGNYHIYIHNVRETRQATSPVAPSQYGGNFGGNGGGTKPRPQTGNRTPRLPSYVPGSQAVNGAVRIFNGSGWTASKTFSIVGLAIMVAKAAVRGATALNDYVCTETGDYSSKIQWDNIQTAIKNVTHPVSSSISAYLTRATWERNDKATAERRTLLGDAQINTLTKGV